MGESRLLTPKTSFENDVVTWNSTEAKREKVPKKYNDFTYDNQTNGGIMNKLDEVYFIIDEIGKDIDYIGEQYGKLTTIYDTFTNYRVLMANNVECLRNSHRDLSSEFKKYIVGMREQIEEHQKVDATLIDDLEVINDMLGGDVCSNGVRTHNKTAGDLRADNSKLSATAGNFAISLVDGVVDCLEQQFDALYAFAADSLHSITALDSALSPNVTTANAILAYDYSSALMDDAYGNKYNSTSIRNNSYYFDAVHNIGKGAGATAAILAETYLLGPLGVVGNAAKVASGAGSLLYAYGSQAEKGLATGSTYDQARLSGYAGMVVETPFLFLGGINGAVPYVQNPIADKVLTYGVNAGMNTVKNITEDAVVVHNTGVPSQPTGVKIVEADPTVQAAYKPSDPSNKGGAINYNIDKRYQSKE